MTKYVKCDRMDFCKWDKCSHYGVHEEGPDCSSCYCKTGRADVECVEV